MSEYECFFGEHKITIRIILLYEYLSLSHNFSKDNDAIKLPAMNSY